MKEFLNRDEVKVRELLSPNTKALQMYQYLEGSPKVQSYLRTANRMAVSRLGYTDHGHVHAEVATWNALKIFDILDEIFQPNIVAEGIGDTIRVSLTRDPVDEVRVGYEILKALKIRQRGPDIVSCPTCGRCDIDLVEVVERVESALITKTAPVQLAIMGCVVNGPGEAREADIGIAGGRGHGVLFRKGKVVRKVREDVMVETLLKEVEAYEAKG